MGNLSSSERLFERHYGHFEFEQLKMGKMAQPQEYHIPQDETFAVKTQRWKSRSIHLKRTDEGKQQKRFQRSSIVKKLRTTKLRPKQVLERSSPLTNSVSARRQLAVRRYSSSLADNKLMVIREEHPLQEKNKFQRSSSCSHQDKTWAQLLEMNEPEQDLPPLPSPPPLPNKNRNRRISV
uniref:Uncharacterized protein n=1 Tax=Mucochytrium quahogii TaxID=96639 RepID=A0A7S2WQ08_9STRA|mmetsp:Transcript_6739/g.10663  ORF Transcript_6739/g.10663 Transcript_6739/m.10663 type:complete len:180 (+) Transcript_6739:359-898(+)